MKEFEGVLLLFYYLQVITIDTAEPTLSRVVMWVVSSYLVLG